MTFQVSIFGSGGPFTVTHFICWTQVNEDNEMLYKTHFNLRTLLINASMLVQKSGTVQMEKDAAESAPERRNNGANVSRVERRAEPVASSAAA